MASLFRWASDVWRGLPTPRSLEAEGWVRVSPHPVWPGSWLMRRPQLTLVTLDCELWLSKEGDLSTPWAVNARTGHGTPGLFNPGPARVLRPGQKVFIVDMEDSHEVNCQSGRGEEGSEG